MRILAKVCKLLLTVLHKFSICVVDDSLSSIVIPSSLTYLLDFTLLLSIINVILLLSMFNPRNIIWNLPGWNFATMLLILNQLRIKCSSLDNFRVASSKFCEHEHIFLSSAKLRGTSVSWRKNIKPFIKRLNNIGPRIEPYGTPLNISW